MLIWWIWPAIFRRNFVKDSMRVIRAKEPFQFHHVVVIVATGSTSLTDSKHVLNCVYIQTPRSSPIYQRPQYRQIPIAIPIRNARTQQRPYLPKVTSIIFFVDSTDVKIIFWPRACYGAPRSKSMHFRRKNLKVRTRYNILNFPAHFFQYWQSSNNGPAGWMAGLTVLKKSAEKMLYISSSDFEIFPPRAARPSTLAISTEIHFHFCYIYNSTFLRFGPAVWTYLLVFP